MKNFSLCPKKILLLLFISICLLQAQPIEIPYDGLIGYYPFDGNAFNMSPNRVDGTDGTILGAQFSFDRTSTANSSLAFDGMNDYDSVGPILKSKHISYGLWFNTTSNSGHLIRWRTNGFDFNLTSGGFINPTIWVGPNDKYEFTDRSKIVNDGDWHQIFATFDGNTFTYYLDGKKSKELDTLGSNRNVYYSGSDGLVFGRDNVNGGYFNGRLDDICIYSRALDSTEVVALYDKTKQYVLNKPTVATSWGLVACYTFNGNANNDGPNQIIGSDGEVFGSTLVTSRNGYSQNAFNFDGMDDYIWIGDTIHHPEVSVSLWFNADLPYKGKILRWRQSGYTIEMRPNGVIEIVLFVDTIQPQQYFYQGSTPLSMGWHHLVFTYDGAEIKVYIDNSFEWSDNQHGANKAVVYGTEGMAIGRDANISAEYFDGIIDDLSIYNRAIDTAEIASLYTHGKPPITTMSIEAINNSDLKIFPNPATNRIVLRSTVLTGPAEIRLIDVFGKEAFRNKIDRISSADITLPTLSSGVYTVIVIFNNKRLVQKLLIK